jgi:hypothetical protein
MTVPKYHIFVEGMNEDEYFGKMGYKEVEARGGGTTREATDDFSSRVQVPALPANPTAKRCKHSTLLFTLAMAPLRVSSLRRCLPHPSKGSSRPRTEPRGPAPRCASRLSARPASGCAAPLCTCRVLVARRAALQPTGRAAALWVGVLMATRCCATSQLAVAMR